MKFDLKKFALKNIKFIGIGLLVITIFAAFYIVNSENSKEQSQSVTNDIYQNKNNLDITDDNLIEGQGSPILKLLDLYDKGEIPEFAGYYADMSGKTQKIIVRMKGMKEESIEKIRAIDEAAIFEYADAEFDLMELNEAFSYISKNMEQLEGLKSTSVDLANNRIVVQCQDENIIRELIKSEIDINVVSFIPESSL